MTNIRKSSMAKKDEGQRLELRRLDDLFEGLRKEMDNMFRPWPVMGAWHVPSLQNLSYGFGLDNSVDLAEFRRITVELGYE